MINKNAQQKWTVVGDFSRLRDLEAEIEYSNKDRYKGKVDIENNQVYRTEGKICNNLGKHEFVIPMCPSRNPLLVGG